MNSNKLKNLLHIGLSLAVTIACLYFAFQKISMEDILQTTNEINWGVVVIVSVMALVAIALRAWRWSYILKPITTLPIGKLFNITMIGFMANNVLPAHAGELVRAFLLSKKGKISFFAVTSTILIERLFDGVTLVILLVSVLFFIDGPAWLQYGSITATAVVISALVFLALLASEKSKLRKFILNLVEKIPGKLRGKVKPRVKAFIFGLDILKDWTLMTPVLLLSIFIWLFMGATVFIILNSFPIHQYVDLNIGLFSMTTVILLALAIVIPSSPGYIGVTQFVFITTFGLFVNMDTVASIAKGYILNGSVIFNLTQYIPITLFGIILLFKEGLSLKSLNIKKEKLPVVPPIPGKIDVQPDFE